VGRESSAAPRLPPPLGACARFPTDGAGESSTPRRPRGSIGSVTPFAGCANRSTRFYRVPAILLDRPRHAPRDELVTIVDDPSFLGAPGSRPPFDSDGLAARKTVLVDAAGPPPTYLLVHLQRAPKPRHKSTAERSGGGGAAP